MDAHISDEDVKQYAPIRYTTPEENKKEEEEEEKEKTEKPRAKLTRKSSLRKAAETPTLKKNVSFNHEVEIKTDDLDTVIVQVKNIKMEQLFIEFSHYVMKRKMKMMN